MTKKVYSELAIALFVYDKNCIATSNGPYGDAIDGFNGENYKIGF